MPFRAYHYFEIYADALGIDMWCTDPFLIPKLIKDLSVLESRLTWRTIPEIDQEHYPGGICTVRFSNLAEQQVPCWIWVVRTLCFKGWEPFSGTGAGRAGTLFLRLPIERDQPQIKQGRQIQCRICLAGRHVWRELKMRLCKDARSST
jgi:hypothetical protein